jgi:hypothetical protein
MQHLSPAELFRIPGIYFFFSLALMQYHENKKAKQESSKSYTAGIHRSDLNRLLSVLILAERWCHFDLKALRTRAKEVMLEKK